MILESQSLSLFASGGGAGGGSQAAPGACLSGEVGHRLDRPHAPRAQLPPVPARLRGRGGGGLLGHDGAAADHRPRGDGQAGECDAFGHFFGHFWSHKYGLRMRGLVAFPARPLSATTSDRH
eukprot:621915-Prorocentrum_minimum.AAC.1